MKFFASSSLRDAQALALQFMLHTEIFLFRHHALCLLYRRKKIAVASMKKGKFISMLPPSGGSIETSQTDDFSIRTTAWFTSSTDICLFNGDQFSQFTTTGKSGVQTNFKQENALRNEDSTDAGSWALAKI